MSGYADPVLEEEARRQGAHYLDKAAPPETMLGMIAEMLSDRASSGGSASA
jgi:hypothetical protein